MALADFLTGTPTSSQQFPTISPQQQGLKSAVTNQALSSLQGLGNQFSFAPIANQARTQFQTQTIPSLAERFTSLGGGQRSSAFQGALGQAGAGLEQGLASLQSQYGLQNQQQQNQLLNSLLGYSLSPEVQTLINPQQQGFLQTSASSIAPFIGQLLPMLLSSLINPIGGIGSGLSSLLSLFGSK